MSALRIKSCGLSDVDNSSLRSMLKLAESLLNHPWQLVDNGNAELTVYSLDSEQGRHGWQQHSDGLKALLISGSQPSEDADAILKKPLRTKNFSQVLNKIEKNIKFAQQAQKLAQLNSSQADSNNHQSNIKPDKKDKKSFFSSIKSRLSSKKGPVEDLPALTLYLPEQKQQKPDTILEPTLLQQWLDGLPENDTDKITSAILGHIVPLNRASVSMETRLALLDIYRSPIQKLVFHRDLTAIKRELNSPLEYLRSIKQVSTLLEELSIGYKIIVNEAYQAGDKPNSNELYLTAIIRSSELISLLIVHAYRYYRSAPTSTINELNQLYIYCEASNTLNKIVNNKNFVSEKTFYQFYCQIILTGIADPYSLPKYEVFRLFKLMASMADKIEINVLTEKQKKYTSGHLATGTFCIDCDGDQLPVAFNKSQSSVRESTNTRIFNTEGVLRAIEQIFKKYTQSSRGGYDLDLQLLKKIIPQINSTYQRKYERLPVVQQREANLVYGLKSIHQGFNSTHVSFMQWHVSNQGNHGMMLSRDSKDCHQLSIGELVGLFEQDKEPKLSTIRWLHADNNDITHIGLEITSNEFKLVTMIADGETKIIHGVLLTPDKDSKQVASLLVEKGIYSNNRTLRIKQDDETYVVTADALIENGINHDHFSFKVKKQS